MDRWDGIERPYTEEDVQRLRGTVRVEHTLARLGCGAPVAAPAGEGLCRRAGRDDRRPGGADGQGRPGGDLPFRLAGRG